MTGSATSSELERERQRLRWLDEHPCNADGADKTWVVEALRRLERFFREAKRLPGAGPDGSVR